MRRETKKKTTADSSELQNYILRSSVLHIHTLAAYILQLSEPHIAYAARAHTLHPFESLVMRECERAKW